MDCADVEMVNQPSKKFFGIPLSGNENYDDNVLPADEFNEDLSHFPQNLTSEDDDAMLRQRRRSNIVILCLGITLIGSVIFLVGSVYVSPDEIFSLPGEQQYTTTSGVVSNDEVNGNSEQNMKKKMSQHTMTGHTKQKHKPGHGHSSWVEQFKGDNNNTGNSFGIEPAGWEEESEHVDDYSDWLAATVTKDDGIMFEIIDQLEHDKSAFLEGLTYVKETNLIYESTGMQGNSDIRILNPDSGEIIKIMPMEKQYFGEGLTYCSSTNKLIQLTYKKKTGFLYNLDYFDESGYKPEEFKFDTRTGEGWGLTYIEDSNDLVVSDGSNILQFWDPNTFQLTKELEIFRMSGKPAKNINELEYWRERIVANVWYEDVIIVINPTTGIVEKEYDFSTLWPREQRRQAHADVLNGISISPDPDTLYFTGKYWDRMFKIKLLH